MTQNHASAIWKTGYGHLPSWTAKRKNNLKKWVHSKGPADNIKHTSICIIGVPGKERKWAHIPHKCWKSGGTSQVRLLSGILGCWWTAFMPHFLPKYNICSYGFHSLWAEIAFLLKTYSILGFGKTLFAVLEQMDSQEVLTGKPFTTRKPLLEVARKMQRQWDKLSQGP